MSFSKTQLKTYAHNKRVLIVEDDRITRAILEAFLKEYFSFLAVARNGAEALRIYKRYKFDLVVSDINLPHVNGLQFIHEVKKQNDEQAILVLSSREDAECLIDLIDLHIDSFVKKPIDSNMIGRNILKILEHQFFKHEIEDYNNKMIIEHYLRTNSLDSIQERKSIIEKQKYKILEITTKEAIDKIEEKLPKDEKTFLELARLKYPKIDDTINSIFILIDELESNILNILYFRVDEIYLENIARIFSKLYYEINSFDELSQIADRLFQIHEFFEKFDDLDTLDADQKEVFEYTQYLLDDMKSFVVGVFIESNTKDMSFYVNLIYQSIESMEIKLYGQKNSGEVFLF